MTYSSIKFCWKLLSSSWQTMAGKTIDSSQYNCLGRDEKQIDLSLPKQLTQHVIFKKSKLGICQTKWILLWTGGIQGWALLAELWMFYCLVRQISRGYECFLCGDVRHQQHLHQAMETTEVQYKYSNHDKVFGCAHFNARIGTYQFAKQGLTSCMQVWNWEKRGEVMTD